MDREIGDRTILDEFASDFSGIIEKHAKYMIVSGFVAIAHGRSRGTEDIDIIMEAIPKEVFTKLHKELTEEGFECIQSSNPYEIYDSYLSKDLGVRYIRKGTHIPEIELKFSKDEIDEQQLKARKRLPLTGLDVYFSSIEANIAFKEELLKSDKDIEDARHLRIVYEGKINEQEIEKIKSMIRRLRIK